MSFKHKHRWRETTTISGTRKKACMICGKGTVYAGGMKGTGQKVRNNCPVPGATALTMRVSPTYPRG